MIEVPGGRRVLLDAAHNPAGAWALASYLKREFPEPLPIVFGALRDKDVSLMLKALAAGGLDDGHDASPTRRGPIRAEELAAIAGKLSPDAKIEVEPDPARALERAWTTLPGRVRSRIDLSRRQSPRRPRPGRARSVSVMGKTDPSRRSLRLRATKAGVILRKPAFSCSVRMINLFRGALIAVALLARDAAVRRCPNDRHPGLRHRPRADTAEP